MVFRLTLVSAIGHKWNIDAYGPLLGHRWYEIRIFTHKSKLNLTKNNEWNSNEMKNEKIKSVCPIDTKHSKYV